MGVGSSGVIDYPGVIDFQSRSDIPASFTGTAQVGTQLYVGDGVGLAPVNGLYLSASNTAAQNQTLIQSALDSAGAVNLLGSGVVNLTGTLFIKSDTRLTIDNSLELKAPSTPSGLVLDSSIISAVKSSVTIAWTSGLTATVTWVGHGLSSGDPVWIVGAAQYQFLGVFAVESVTNVNTVTIKLNRLPTTTATGGITAIKADSNIYISGGIWNKNYTGGNVNTGSQTHTIRLGGVAGLTVENMNFKDSQKYCICLGAVKNVVVKGITTKAVSSDGIKLYGPAFGVSISNVSGVYGDDVISMQTKEPALYASYIWTFGDVLNVDIKNINAYTPTGLVTLYPNETGLISAIKISSCSNEAGGAGIKIDANDPASTNSNVGVVSVDNCRISGNPLFILTTSATVLNVRSLSIKNCSIENTINQGRFLSVASGINANVTITGGDALSTDNVANIVAGAGNVINLSIFGMSVGSSWNTFNFDGSGIVNMLLNGFTCLANPGSNWLNAASTVTVNITAMAVSVPSGYPAISKAAGAFITAYGGGLGVDLAKLDRSKASQMCIAAVNSGTILAGNVAINDATNTTNSWKQLTNTALAY